MCQQNRKRILYCSLILFAIIYAVAIRIPELSLRPMHTDEAVQAVKFGDLLENNVYTYDSHEYHGPTLYYFTLIPAWLSSAENITEISENTVRTVPAVFGILLIAMLLLLVNGLGRQIVIIAGILTAVSPAMTYYSRYYIQEMLLVFFACAVIVFGYRYIKSRKIGWALLTGMSLGLLHATKETCIIVIGALAAALFLTMIFKHKNSIFHFLNLGSVDYRHVAAMLGIMAAVSALFYSSFFTNPAGIVDSYAAYGSYLNKAANNAWHIHPWYYYLNMLIFFKSGSGPVWSEAFIVFFAAAGVISIVLKKGLSGVDPDLLRFSMFYTIILTVIYSVIPYKTPWLMLGFLHGMILLAAVGIFAVLNVFSGKRARIILLSLLALGGTHLAVQSYLANYRYFADPSNPYVYAHTSVDVFHIVQQVNEMALVHPDGKLMYIEVVCPSHDYWPLPWYFREYENIGWRDEVDFETAPAPLIVASPEVEPDVIRNIYEFPPPGERNLYVPLFESNTQLRPSVELRGYVRKDLWDKYVQNEGPVTGIR
ncbi:flippase activity-associated protein Agl23 [candidate division KSB1 bacterium]